MDGAHGNDGIGSLLGIREHLNSSKINSSASPPPSMPPSLPTSPLRSQACVNRWGTRNILDFFPQEISTFRHSILLSKPPKKKSQDVKNIIFLQIQSEHECLYQNNNNVDSKRIWKTKIFTVSGKKGTLKSERCANYKAGQYPSAQQNWNLRGYLFYREGGKYHLKLTYLLTFPELFDELYRVDSPKESKDIRKTHQTGLLSIYDVKTSHHHLCASILPVPFSQSPLKTHLQLNKLGLFLVAVKENAPHRELWGVPVRGHEKEPFVGFGLGLSICGSRPKTVRVGPGLVPVRKQGQFCDWGSHHILPTGRETRTRIELWLVKK